MEKMMTCEELRLELEDSGGASLPSHEARAHLLVCADCAEYAESFAVISVLLRENLKPSRQDPAWPRVRAALRRRICPVAPPLERPQTCWAPRVRWGAAALAVLALGAALAAVALTAGSNPRKSVWAEEPTQPERLALLQQRVRSLEVLDKLQDLQTALAAEGRRQEASLTEDAEVYVERILQLDEGSLGEAPDMLKGINRARLPEKLRCIGGGQRPEIRSSAQLVAATLDEALRLASQGSSHAN